MAKIILTFGHDRYLLPSERGVATLLSTLAAAQPLTWSEAQKVREDLR